MNRTPKTAVAVSSLLALFSSLTVSAQDLIYVPVEPCRIVNQLATAPDPDPTKPQLPIPDLVAGKPQSFRSYGIGGELIAQGGDYCPHPKEALGLEPVAIAANVTAVGTLASGRGNIVAFPSGGAVSGSSLVYFTRLANISNSTIITLCEPDTCTGGYFDLLANFADVPVIVDVQGYFYPRYPAAEPAGYSNAVLRGTYQCQGVMVGVEGASDDSDDHWAGVGLEPFSLSLTAYGDGRCTYSRSGTIANRSWYIAFEDEDEDIGNGSAAAYLATQQETETTSDSGSFDCSVALNGAVAWGSGEAWLSLDGNSLTVLSKESDKGLFEAISTHCVRTALEP